MLIKKICYSEKFTRLTTDCNMYVFDVVKDATKSQIKECFFKKFGLKPIAVNTICRSGKLKTNRMRKGHYGRTNGRKIAIISLKKGDKLDIV